MKVAIVVQRYGHEVLGGAETLAQQVSQKLTHVLGWQVEVLTTCARDYTTWDYFYPEGTTTIDGVVVRRFRHEYSRSKFFPYYDRLLHICFGRLKSLFPSQGRARYFLEWLWIYLQGPYCPRLVQYLKRQEHQYQMIVFVTYLYYPTIAGVLAVKDPKKILIIPTAHDEFAFYFELVHKILVRAKTIFSLAAPEADLIRRVAGEHLNIKQAGMGFDFPAMIAIENQTDVLAAPYILYMGRVSSGKGVDRLLQWFRTFKQQNPSSKVELHIAGRNEDIRFDDFHEWGVVYHGFVDEPKKKQLMHSALAIVNPSAHESLSIIVVEALALGKPALVCTDSAVLAHYVRSTKSVFGFADEKSFSASLSKILESDWASLNNKLVLKESREWAYNIYAWERVLEEYKAAVLTKN